MINLSYFFPSLLTQDLDQFAEFENISTRMNSSQLTQDWQSHFSQSIFYPTQNLPWNVLRARQFNLDPLCQTICCCDPVLLQLTHRGAYMLGQQPLTLHHNDAIRIVAQINEKLMGEGEHLYLVDKFSWLYTSNKPRHLDSERIENLIGKDMFGFRYGGDENLAWQQLATEIQMLIKQMIDYQGLPDTAGETMMNVHFWDCASLAQASELAFVKHSKLSLFADNELIKTLASDSMIDCRSLAELGSNDSHIDHRALLQSNQNNVCIVFESEQEYYASILKHIEKQLDDKLVSIKVFTQNSCLSSTRPHWIRKWLNKLTASTS